MTYSKGSVVVGHERAHDGLAGVPVVPDGGGEGQDSLEDTDQDAVWGVSTMLFKSELPLEGVIDGFNGLADGVQECAAGAWGLALVGGSDHGGVSLAKPCLDGGVAVALVDDEDEPVRME